MGRVKGWMSVAYILAAVGGAISCSGSSDSPSEAGGCVSRVEVWSVVGSPVSEGCPGGAELAEAVSSPHNLDINGDEFLDARATYNAIDDACCYRTRVYSE